MYTVVMSGDREGEAVGCTVGVSVGSAEWAIVGYSIGATEGSLRLGTLEGSPKVGE